MHKQVRLNDKNKKLYSSNMNMENLIYTINMSREDLSKMTKQQLIDMLLGQKPKTVSAKFAGPVDQTVCKPKSLVQRAAEKLEHSIKRPAILPKQSYKMPT